MKQCPKFCQEKSIFVNDVDVWTEGHRLSRILKLFMFGSFKNEISKILDSNEMNNMYVP